MKTISACVALLLGMYATTAQGAKCVLDAEFERFPRDVIGYNYQTHRPYFGTAMNSYITSDNYLVVDRSRGETGPPLHWEHKSIRLSWPAYTGPEELLGYKLQRQDYLYVEKANASEVVFNDTTATRPNHASAYRVWNVFRVGRGQQLTKWASAEVACGRFVDATTGGMEVAFLTADMGPEPMPDVLPYPPEKFEDAPGWNPMVARILAERRAWGGTDPVPGNPGNPGNPGKDPKDPDEDPGKDPDQDPGKDPDEDPGRDPDRDPGTSGKLMVPLFPHAAHPFQTPTVRVTNHSDESGEVHIEAISDLGVAAGPAMLRLDPNATVGFNSRELEGDAAKEALVSGTGPLEDRYWRLMLESDLEIEVLSYIRTPDGLIVPMHESVARCEVEESADKSGDKTADKVGDKTGKEKHYPGVYRLPFFNPGSNQTKRSILRVINPGTEAAALSISGTDESGAMAAQTVLATVPAGSAVNISAAELESGEHEHIDSGALGDGAGKWRLRVESSAAVTILNLMHYASGHVFNLSAAECR